MEKVMQLKRFWVALGIASVSALVLWVCFACTGCRALRHSTTTKDSTAKTVLADTNTKVSTEKEIAHFHSETDSVGKIGGGDVQLHLTPIDIEPVYTTVGVQVPRYFFAQDGSMVAKATVNKDGSIDIDCKQDSLTAVLKRLVKDSVISNTRIDSAFEAGKEVNSRIYRETIDRMEVREPWYKRYGDMVLIFLLGVLIGYLAHLIVSIAKV